MEQETEQVIHETINTFRDMRFQELISGLIVLAVCVVLIKYLLKLLDNVLDNSHHVDVALHSMIRTIARWVLYFVAIVATAGAIGIPVTSFVALFSVVGLAVSLAVQDVLANFTGGVIILVSKPFKPGDFIESDSVTGTVLEIGFLHTKLYSPDGRVIYMQNSSISADKLINYTASGFRRVELTVGASYDSTPAEVRAAILEAVHSVEGIQDDPAPEVMLINYRDSDIQYQIWVWVPASEFLRVKFELGEALYGHFRDHNVAMSYPHLNVHIVPD